MTLVIVSVWVLSLFSYMVGMVDKIGDEAQKLPESNKMAYRLLFVEVGHPVFVSVVVHCA